MFYRLTGPTHEGHANRNIVLRCEVLIAVLSSLLLFNGCAGRSFPTSGSTIPPANSTTTSTPNLTISADLPPASVGLNYNASVTVTGGTSPYTFSTVSGQLPEGVLLAATNGTISGTPTASGGFSFAISVSDSKGLSKQQALQISVASAASTSTSGGNGGKTFSNLQSSSGWGQYGQGPPSFVDCSPSPCDGITFSMQQGIQSPSMSGESTQYSLGGTAPYNDGLWNNHLIGPFSSQGLPDTSHSLAPTLHDFTYDVYFFGSNLALSQALEFDINQFFNSMGFIWGHECRIAGGSEWDVWNNQTAHWTPTGIPCHPNNNAWNHLTIQVQRTSNNELLYQSITLNGVTSNLNWTFAPGPAPANWYGVTVNYQMDGNNKQDSYSVYLDNLTFTYQ
ncbi:MAG TPA: Ig domain-containing protein [Candidatus Acidoferrum sp.]|nr:Ig domain-containing protein [Candidatus Acidoferrum sp.]